MGDGFSMAKLAHIAPSHYLVEALKGSTPAPVTLSPDMVTGGGGAGANKAEIKKKYFGLAATDCELALIEGFSKSMVFWAGSGALASVCLS